MRITQSGTVIPFASLVVMRSALATLILLVGLLPSGCANATQTGGSSLSEKSVSWFPVELVGSPEAHAYVGSVETVNVPNLPKDPENELVVGYGNDFSPVIAKVLAVRKRGRKAVLRRVLCIPDLPLAMRRAKTLEEANTIFRLGQDIEYGFERFSMANVDRIVLSNAAEDRAGHETDCESKAEWSGEIRVNGKLMDAAAGARTLLRAHPTILEATRDGGFVARRLVLLTFNDRGVAFALLYQGLGPEGTFAQHLSAIEFDNAEPVGLETDLLVGF